MLLETWRASRRTLAGRETWPIMAKIMPPKCIHLIISPAELIIMHDVVSIAVVLSADSLSVGSWPHKIRRVVLYLEGG